MTDSFLKHQNNSPESIKSTVDKVIVSSAKKTGGNSNNLTSVPSKSKWMYSKFKRLIKQKKSKLREFSKSTSPVLCDKSQEKGEYNYQSQSRRVSREIFVKDGRKNNFDCDSKSISEDKYNIVVCNIAVDENIFDQTDIARVVFDGSGMVPSSMGDNGDKNLQDKLKASYCHKTEKSDRSLHRRGNSTRTQNSSKTSELSSGLSSHKENPYHIDNACEPETKAGQVKGFVEDICLGEVSVDELTHRVPDASECELICNREVKTDKDVCQTVSSRTEHIVSRTDGSRTKIDVKQRDTSITILNVGQRDKSRVEYHMSQTGTRRVLERDNWKNYSTGSFEYEHVKNKTIDNIETANAGIIDSKIEKRKKKKTSEVRVSKKVSSRPQRFEDRTSKIETFGKSSRKKANENTRLSLPRSKKGETQNLGTPKSIKTRPKSKTLNQQQSSPSSPIAFDSPSMYDSETGFSNKSHNHLNERYVSFKDNYGCLDKSNSFESRRRQAFKKANEHLKILKQCFYSPEFNPLFSIKSKTLLDECASNVSLYSSLPKSSQKSPDRLDEEYVTFKDMSMSVDKSDSFESRRRQAFEKAKTHLKLVKQCCNSPELNMLTNIIYKTRTPLDECSSNSSLYPNRTNLSDEFSVNEKAPSNSYLDSQRVKTQREKMINEIISSYQNNPKYIDLDKAKYFYSSVNSHNSDSCPPYRLNRNTPLFVKRSKTGPRRGRRSSEESDMDSRSQCSGFIKCSRDEYRKTVCRCVNILSMFCIATLSLYGLYALWFGFKVESLFINNRQTAHGSSAKKTVPEDQEQNNFKYIPTPRLFEESRHLYRKRHSDNIYLASHEARPKGDLRQTPHQNIVPKSRIDAKPYNIPDDHQSDVYKQRKVNIYFQEQPAYSRQREETLQYDRSRPGCRGQEETTHDSKYININSEHLKGSYQHKVLNIIEKVISRLPEKADLRILKKVPKTEYKDTENKLYSENENYVLNSKKHLHDINKENSKNKSQMKKKIRQQNNAKGKIPNEERKPCGLIDMFSKRCDI